MRVIKVPKTPKSAFNPRRPAGLLLQSQIEHLEAALQNQMPSIPLARSAAGLAPVRSAPAAGMRSAPPPAAPPVAWTEGDAAAYIAELTSRLDPSASPAATVQNAVTADAEEQGAARARGRAGSSRRAPAARSKRKASRKSKAGGTRKTAPRKTARTSASGTAARRKSSARTATARKATSKSRRAGGSTAGATSRRRSTRTSKRGGGKKR